MADIRLAKPAAGTTQTVPSAPDGRFIFDFPADAATLTRNGDDLVLTFEDGAAIQLQGFYTTYSKEEMPSFQVDGVEISGQDFFAALDEDLMPAAGPASGSSAARGGRYNEYGGSDLLDGLDHLGRLDIGFDGGTQLATDTVEPSPYSEVDHGVTVTPSGVGAATEVVTVYEAGLAGGSQAGEKDAPTMAGGSLSINAPDGVVSIVIGGVVVFENGALTGKVVSTDEGTLSVTGYDPATGKLDFSYSLDRNTTEHVKSDPDTDTQISHTLVVTVTDTDGDSGSTTITVNVVDDAPTAVDDTVIGEEAQAQQGMIEGNVLKNDKTGADGPNAVTSVKHGDEESMAGSALKGAYGELTLNADGTYTYKLDKNVDVEKDESVTETFTYTITDADGDTSEATLTITIRGDEKEPVAPGEDKAEIVVDEGALSDGSGQHVVHGISGKDSFTVNLNGEDGTITLKYGTGENSSITLSLINGDTFDEKWLSPNTTLTVNGVEVTVTGATQTEPGGPWKIEYTYELTGQQTHDNVGSAGAVGADDALSDSINITVTDATGDTSTGSLMVTVHDDGPVLTVSSDPNDTLEWTDGATGAYTTESGSLTLETGADGLKEGSLQVTDDAGNNATFDAEGKATINYEDGSKLEAAYDAFTGKISYTYTPGAGTETTDRSFTFSALDTDDDSASATVSIKVDLADSGDVPATVPSIEVDESGLADGTMPDPGMITKPITLPEGYTLNTEGWSDGGDGALTYSVNEGKGLLTYKDGKLTYTLQDNYDHANPAQDNEGLADGSKPTFDLSLTHDATGVKVSTTVTVDVLDDAPVLTAKIDTQPGNDKGYYYDTDAAIVFRLAEGGLTTKLSDIDFGADVGTEEGESDPARITVTVNNTTTFTVEVTRDAEGKLLFNGENTGTITFDKTGAATGADDGSKLTYDTVTGQFTYTRPTADVGGTANEYTFTLTVTDADGDTVQQTGSVVTVFREPTITGDDGSTSSTVTTDEGNLEQGSDWETDATLPHEDTASGELTVNLYHADGTIQIGENLTIGVDKDGKVVSVNGNPAASLDGKTVPGDHGHLSNITVSEAGTDGSITIKYDYTLTNAVDGDGASDNRPAEGEDGRGESMQADSFAVTVTANGQTATGSIMANALDDAPTLSVDPEATSTQNDTTDSSLSGTFTVNFGADSENAALMIDGRSVSLTEETSLEVDGGTLTITPQSDGTYAYTYKHDQQDVTFEKKTFAVVATDGDKDWTQATITVGQDFHPTTDDGNFGTDKIHEVVTTDESYMEAGGSQAGQTSDDGIGQSATESVTVNLHGENAETSITITHGEQTITFTYDGMKWSAGGQGSEAVIQGDYGQLSVWVSKALDNDNNVTIGYEYKQTAPYTTHGDPNDANETTEAADSFGITINDRDGTPLTGSISVNIRDDAPVLTAKIDTQPSNDTGYYYDTDAAIVFRLAEGGPTTKLSDIDFGADVGTGEEGSAPARITVTVNSTAFTVAVTRDAEGKLHFSGENTGTITFEKTGADDGSALTYDTASGNFTYTRPTADVGGTADTYDFTLTVTDADGDTVQQTGSVTTKTVAPTISLTDANIIVDEGALAHGSQQHTNDGFAGTKAFTVNLHGEDGTIILSADGGNEITLEVKDGALEIPQNATITVNGVTISALTAQKADDGTSWTVSYDYELTKQQTHTTPNSSNYHEDGKSADLTISVTSQSGQTVTGTLPVTVHDDGPQFTADSTNFTSVDTDTDQYWSHEGEISFTEKTYWNDIKDPQGSIVHVDEQNSVTISIGNVYFADDRKEIPTTDIDQIKTGDGTFFLSENGLGITSWINEDGVDGTLYYEHNITNTQRLQEICYDYANNRSEAVVIELGKTALNMDISLKSFFGGTSEGTEKAIFLFYKDGQLIDTATLSSNSSSGNVTGDHLLVDQPDGFDTVVIAAMHNGVSTDVTQDNSDFAIGALTFNKFDGAIKTLNGRLDATSADGIRSYQIDIEGLSQCGLTYGEQAITYSRDGDKILAKAGDMLIFDITLNEQSGAWVMAQYQDYEGNLALSFTATDGDGDTATLKIPVDSSPSATTLKAEVEARSTMHGVEAMATAAALAGMATVLPDEVPAAEGERPDTPDETLVAAPAEAADAPAALSFVEEGAALPDSPVDGMDDTPLLFANLALAGQEELMVSAVQTDAADGPLWADASGTDDTSGTVVGETATAGPGAAHPGTAAPEAVLHGTDADDILLGGDGDELIFGGSGDDFIDGGEGRDTIYAGDGNDIIVYDQQDYLVSGGSGIDFMVSDDSTLSLTKLLQGTGDGNGPIVDSIEVLITGKDALSLTSLEQMAKDYGISINGSSLELDSTLWAKADNGYRFTGDLDNDRTPDDLFLQVNSQTDAQVSVELVPSDDIAEAVQRAEIEHSNG